jgi:hypothetical protein
MHFIHHFFYTLDYETKADYVYRDAFTFNSLNCFLLVRIWHINVKSKTTI